MMEVPYQWQYSCLFMAWNPLIRANKMMQTTAMAVMVLALGLIEVLSDQKPFSLVAVNYKDVIRLQQ